MKKRFIFLIAAILWTVSLFCGCSFFSQQSSPKIIYKSYIDTSEISSEQGGFLTESAASVVTVISAFQFNGSVFEYEYYSGIIIDREGYIVTVSDAAYSEKYLKVNTAYAVLSDVYNDATRYRLQLIDYDTGCGLAVFSFLDEFHYYTDVQKTTSEDGFQFSAAFSAVAPKIGDACFSVGNNLGDYNSSSSLSSPYLQQTVMSGTVTAAAADAEVISPAAFSGKEYPYILTSASVSNDMIGGALFDGSGYLLGMLSYKLYDVSQSGSATEPLTRISLAAPVGLLCDYIDAVSAESKTVIPYTLVTIGE